MADSTGYGPSSMIANLQFDGDDQKYEMWEVKFMSLMRIKKLHNVFTAAHPNVDQNAQAFAQLSLLLDPRSLALVMRDARDNGKEALAILPAHYQSSGKPPIITLYTELTFKKGSKETIAAYIIRAERAFTMLTAAGETVSESLLVAMVLKGLPEEYQPFVAIVTQSETEYDFSKFKQSLRNFEETEKHRLSTHATEPDSIMKMHSPPEAIVCHGCGKVGHKNPQCPDKKKKKSKKWCGPCKSTSHNLSECRNQARNQQKKVSDNKSNHSYQFMLMDSDDDGVKEEGDHPSFFQPEHIEIVDIPEEHPTSIIPSNTDQTLVKSLDETVENVDTQINSIDNEHVLQTEDSKEMLVDSGSTRHVSNEDRGFIRYDESFKPSDHCVELADGTKTWGVAKKKGDMLIQVKDSNGDVADITLNDVLYMPSYPQNVFSVKAAVHKSSARVVFEKDNSAIYAPDGTRFPLQEKNSLYYLCKVGAVSERSDDLETWHRILGHCNTQDVISLETHASNMKITNKSSFDCETCNLSKLTNSHNKSPSANRASEPFAKVYTDVAGPIDPAGREGFRWVIIFTDEYSGCSFTYFMKKKSDTVLAMKKFFADISPYGKVQAIDFDEHSIPSTDVKDLRSDNGGEYISKDAEELLVQMQIKHSYTSPYSPHQNGRAERNWRTLFDMARAMLIESAMPKSFWTYAVMTATHIRNRCYSRRLKSTPYAAVTGLKPDIGRLHVFGTVCYSFIQTYKKKLDPRSEKGIFVGYDRNSASYLVYHPEKKVVSKHRVVKFTEKFPSDLNENENHLPLVHPAAVQLEQKQVPEIEE